MDVDDGCDELVGLGEGTFVGTEEVLGSMVGATDVLGEEDGAKRGELVGVWINGLDDGVLLGLRTQSNPPFSSISSHTSSGEQ